MEKFDSVRTPFGLSGGAYFLVTSDLARLFNNVAMKIHQSYTQPVIFPVQAGIQLYNLGVRGAC